MSKAIIALAMGEIFDDHFRRQASRARREDKLAQEQYLRDLHPDQQKLDRCRKQFERKYRAFMDSLK